MHHDRTRYWCAGTNARPTGKQNVEGLASAAFMHVYEVQSRAKINATSLRQGITQEISCFCEMSIFECFRRYHEDKSNRPRLRLGLFLLVRRLKSVARCSSRHPRLGDFLSMMEEAMGITPIVFVLIILLFGFDSTEQVRTQLALKDRARNLKFSEISIFERLRKK